MSRLRIYSFFLVISVTILGIFLRFYNLNWGAPYYFHPDERNIAASIMQLSFPSHMNPHFFAYGSFPLYLSFLLASFLSFITNTPLAFTHAILALRIFSALLSVGIPLSLLYIGNKLYSPFVGILSSMLATFSVGLVQYAHFGTFEMWLTFFSLWMFYASIRLLDRPTLRQSSIVGILGGLLIGSKISSVVILVFPLIILFFAAAKKNISFSTGILIFARILFVAACIYLLTNPFVVTTPQEFFASIHYESSVALGILPVFYTQTFFQTTPVLFQFLYSYPFLLNPLIEVLFVLSFIDIMWYGYTKKNSSFLLLCIYFLLLFMTQAFLFVKWTRYIVPTLPIIFLTIGVFVERIKLLRTGILFLVIGTSVFWSGIFVYEVYTLPDTRIAAASWATSHIQSTSPFLSEAYDIGILPFNASFNNIQLLNMYALDSDPLLSQQLPDILASKKYILLPSDRLVESRLRHKEVFPQGYEFYTKLLRGTEGYTKIYQTPCDVWCSILYIGNPIVHVEETVTVFDRPTVFLFQKK